MNDDIKYSKESPFEASTATFSSSNTESHDLNHGTFRISPHEYHQLLSTSLGDRIDSINQHLTLRIDDNQKRINDSEDRCLKEIEKLRNSFRWSMGIVVAVATLVVTILSLR